MRDEDRLSINVEALKDGKLTDRKEEVNKIKLSMTNGVNTYIYGSVGAGKTTAIMNVMRKFDHEKNRAIYISGAICQTEYSVLREIIDQINDTFAQKILIQTRSNYDLVKRLKKDLKKFSTLKAVILDNLEAIEEPKVVDYLLEIGFVLILVSDEYKAINRLSAIAQSNFANTILFTPYTQDQVVKIINDKARRLFGSGCYRESLVKKISELCGGNIGYGESLLLASNLKAISSKKECVDETDVPEVRTESELTQDQETILKILKEFGGMPAGKLYQLYCDKTNFPKARRTFRNYMRDLSEKNLIRASGTNKGRVYEVVR